MHSAQAGRCRPLRSPFMAASSMGSPTRLGPAGVGVGVGAGPPGGVVKREVEGSERKVEDVGSGEGGEGGGGR